jgi:hypothetical protein
MMTASNTSLQQVTPQLSSSAPRLLTSTSKDLCNSLISGDSDPAPDVCTIRILLQDDRQTPVNLCSGGSTIRRQHKCSEAF